MDNIIKEILRCPICKGKLDNDNAKSFFCPDCEMSFPVNNGVPDFIVYDNEAAAIKKSFQFQWEKRFEGKMEDASFCFGERPEKVIGYIDREVLSKLQDNNNKRKVFLDAGCGSGDKAISLAKMHPEVIVVAFDLSNTVEKSKAIAAGLNNIFFMKADINRLPFAKEAFDFVMSFGVLHHTSDTERAFKNLSKLLKKENSAYLVWLYLDPVDDKARRAYYSRRDFLRRFVKDLPYEKLLFICKLLTLVYFLPKYILKENFYKIWRLKTKGSYPKMKLHQLYRSMYFVLFDNLSPVYQERSKKADVITWFKQEGYNNIDSDKYDGLFFGFK